MVDAIREILPPEETTNLSYLTTIPRSQWLEIIDKPTVGVPPETRGRTSSERKLSYVRSIQGQLERSYPMDFLVNRLQDHEALSPLPAKPQVISFLDKAKAHVDLSTTPLIKYLKENPSAVDDLEDAPLVTDTLRSVQRMQAISGSLSCGAGLVAAGFRSAYEIVRFGQSEFVDFVANKGILENKTHALLTFDNAIRASSMAMTLVANYGWSRSQPSLAAYRDPQLPSESGGDTDSIGIPNWSTLFGDESTCVYDDTQAVDGPLAYYVDLLQFLGRQSSKVEGKTARDILFGRRPDLGDVQLTTANAKTPLPYVDLVIETLEDAVSPPPVFQPYSIPMIPAIHFLDRGSLDFGQIRSKLSLSDYATVVIVKKGAAWNIEDLNYTYSLTFDTKKLQIRIGNRSRQTTGSAGERAAKPQYLNVDA